MDQRAPPPQGSVIVRLEAARPAAASWRNSEAQFLSTSDPSFLLPSPILFFSLSLYPPSPFSLLFTDLFPEGFLTAVDAGLRFRRNRA